MRTYAVFFAFLRDETAPSLLRTSHPAKDLPVPRFSSDAILLVLFYNMLSHVECSCARLPVNDIPIALAFWMYPIEIKDDEQKTYRFV